MTDPSGPLTDAVFSIDIRAPRQRVWEEITRLGSVSDILFHTILESELTPGAKLRYWSPDKKNIWIVGTVMEVTPPSRFVHTYRFTDITDESETVVTWELTEAPDGTRVTLTHSGFTDQAKTHKKVSGGWVTILDLLKVVAEGGRLGFKWKAMYWMMDSFGWMMPKSTRADEVIRSGG